MCAIINIFLLINHLTSSILSVQAIPWLMVFLTLGETPSLVRKCSLSTRPRAALATRKKKFDGLGLDTVPLKRFSALLCGRGLLGKRPSSKRLGKGLRGLRSGYLRRTRLDYVRHIGGPLIMTSNPTWDRAAAGGDGQDKGRWLTDLLITTSLHVLSIT
jgi:hypothetical protein